MKKSTYRKSYLLPAIIPALICFFIIFQSIKDAGGLLFLDFFSPFLSVIRNSKTGISNYSLQLESKRDLILTAEKYQKENIKYKLQQDSISKIKLENIKLRKLLNLELNKDYKAIFSEVILRPPISWKKSFTINKGSLSGIKPGAIVLSMQNHNIANSAEDNYSIIGKVKLTTKHTAIISTIFNKDCNFSVKCGVNNSLGVTQNIANKLIINYLDNNSRLKKGAKVYSSGFNKDTPAGYYLGEIDEVSEIDDLYKQATLKAAVDIKKIKFIIILVEDL